MTRRSGLICCFDRQAFPALTDCVPPLPSTSTVIIVVKDAVLLKAIMFALEAHGYSPSGYSSWQQVGDQVSRASFIILDSCLPPEDQADCLAAVPPTASLLLLADDDLEEIVRPSFHVLRKPLSGADILDAMAALRRIP